MRVDRIFELTRNVWIKSILMILFLCFWVLIRLRRCHTSTSRSSHPNRININCKPILPSPDSIAVLHSCCNDDRIQIIKSVLASSCFAKEVCDLSEMPGSSCMDISLLGAALMWCYTGFKLEQAIIWFCVFYAIAFALT